MVSCGGCLQFGPASYNHKRPVVSASGAKYEECVEICLEMLQRSPTSLYNYSIAFSRFVVEAKDTRIAYSTALTTKPIKKPRLLVAKIP